MAMEEADEARLKELDDVEQRAKDSEQMCWDLTNELEAEERRRAAAEDRAQRAEAGIRLRIESCARVQEEPDQLEPALLGCDMQRRGAELGRCIHKRTTLQQTSRGLELTPLRGEVQRRRRPTLPR